MSTSAPHGARERAERVVRTLRAAGHAALFAGGCVRDRLLGRTPADWDVATSARPEEVGEAFGTVVPVGARFGVVLVVVDGEPVEVATFRHDANYADGRRPVSVSFSLDPAEDARRRDFTVNGLFLDPEDESVLDFVGGREDLAGGILRAIGDPGDRLQEDRLRMLRAVRLAAGLGFEIEERTWAAVRASAAEIRVVSGERIRDEIFRILAGPDPRRGLLLLRASGLLREVLPEVQSMAGVRQPPRFHPEGDVWTHTLAAVASLRAPGPLLALATLLHDVGKPATRTVRERARFDQHPAVGEAMAREIAGRLRLSRAESDHVAGLVGAHLRFMQIREMREARRRRFLSSPEAEDHLALHRADCLASHGDLENYEFSVCRRAEYLREPARPMRWLTGRDLIDLGMIPGPDFAVLLGEAEDLTLEGVIQSREDALRWARSRMTAGGGRDEA